MRMHKGFVAVILIVPGILGLVSGENGVKQTAGAGVKNVSFKTDVFPVIKKYCLPCHDQENFNPSELSLDSYELLMKGGKHGGAVVPGKPSESILIQKLSATPPFGDMMPLKSRRKKSTEAPKKLTDVEVTSLRVWIEQGAEDN